MQRSDARWVGGLVELPVELLRNVFAHLTAPELCRCACVCSSWTGIVLDATFWRALHFDNLVVDGATVLRVCRRYPELQTLSLRNLALDARTLCALFRTCPAVRELSLAGVRSTGMEQVLFELANVLTGLRELDISTLSITNDTLHRLETRCAQLERLNLSRCTLLPCETTQSGVRMLQLSHARLRELKLCGIRIASTELTCPALEALDVSGSQLSDAMLLPMVTGSAQLRRLTLVDCRNVTDTAVKDLLARCRELRTLNVSGCVCLTSEALRDAASADSRLESLSMSRCPLLSDLCTLPLTSSHLLHLELRHCESLKSLDLSSPSLRELVLTGCRQLCKLTARCEALAALALNGCEALLSVVLHTPLRALELADCRGHLKALELRDDAITSLSLHGFSTMHTLRLECPALQWLDLGRCCALTDASVTDVAASCPALRTLQLEECEALQALHVASPSLRVLNLSGCKGVSSASVRCAALHSLVLEGCSALDEASIACAVKWLDLGTCRQLRRLSLESDSCRALNIKGCLRLAHARVRCASLRLLDLSFCADITDAALRALASTALHELNVSRCMLLSNELLADLATYFPSLRTVNLSYLCIDDATLAAVLSQPLELSSLELAACKELTFSSLECVLAARTLPQLETLDVSYTQADARAVGLLLQLCVGLRALKLNGCGHLECRGSGRALACLSQHAALRHLSLVGCPRVVTLALRSAPKLVEVNLRSCPALAELRALGCPSLKSLSAVNSPELVSVVVDACPALDALDLRSCPPAVSLQLPSLTDVQLRRILRQ